MYNRKRKRHAVKPSSSSSSPSSLQPNDQYQLTDPSSEIPKQEQPLDDDDKVINYLRKMHPRQTVSHPDKPTYVTIIVSTSEGQHFQDLQPNFVTSLRDNFSIKDISISPVVPGCIDRYITVYGLGESISRAILYIAFILNAKLNNIGGSDLFTFKSANYKISLLLKQVHKLSNAHGLKYLDKAEQFTYNFSTKDFHVAFMQGDLHALFNTLLQCSELDLCVDSNDTNVENIPLFGIHADPALYSRSSENSSLLAKSHKNLIDFLHPSKLDSV
ncbi:uncharacterized protein SPAPADRAFT_134563 [Spathaspora passalidarum NRRL Y-27907]|uniref:Uncharacterized protein n=1 Tax=Spathaspora passalidarum (strain NRRL Y-27907 / 11-Y1) TaxID=619300 RepID=G3AHR8_SPAPN|nr:uncharacterized protein SPAPADRAFT_134563 [Spathaspora passalidarum NRRL Y-27907]EGW34232.1 hypothetical protein SPAPADRAFT_134563 [Spathaspora passalidarum NRRL Y-27907]